jgi:hypothetical protein
MIDIPFPVTSNPGKQPGEGTGVLVNCYAEKLGEGAVWRRMPGLNTFAALGLNDVRGMCVVGNVVYVVAGERAIVVDSTGGTRLLDGIVGGTGPVTMARNSQPEPAIALTTNIGNYVLTSLAVQVYPDGDVPQANSVSFADGYFLWTTAGGDSWSSDVNTTSVSALNFQKAESRPDGLLRGFVYQQQYYAAGSSTIEVYQNNGNPIGFPLSRSTVIGIGLIGTWAVAGFEDGWDGEPMFVAADGSVRTLNGLRPSRISTPDVERDIASVADKSTLRACVFTFGGNAIWSLSCPVWTWQYNVTTGSWIRRQSYQSNRWRGDVSVKFGERWILGDVQGQSLLALSIDARTEAGFPLIYGVDSGPVKQFPAKIAVPEAFFDFSLGQGVAVGVDPNETNPRVMLSWSHDGGATFASPLEKTLGLEGKYVGPVRLNRIGLTTHHGVRFRWRISDPCDASFQGGRITPQGRKP